MPHPEDRWNPQPRRPSEGNEHIPGGYAEPLVPRHDDASPFGAPGLTDIFLPAALAALAGRFAKDTFNARFGATPTEHYPTGMLVGMVETSVCSNPVGCGAGTIYMSNTLPSCTFTGVGNCAVASANSPINGYSAIFWARARSLTGTSRFNTGERGNFAPGTVFPTKWGRYVPGRDQTPVPRVSPHFDPMEQPIGRAAPPPVPVPPALAPYRPVRPEGSSRSPDGQGAPPRGARRPRWPRYRPRPPRKGEKERKYYTSGMRVANAILDWVTESLDAAGALWKAIPGNSNKEPPKSPYKLANDLWKNWHRMDVGNVMLELAKEHAEDKAWGALHRATRGAPGLGVDSPVQKAKRGVGIVIRDYIS